jgi:hypothetical protein
MRGVRRVLRRLWSACTGVSGQRREMGRGGWEAAALVLVLVRVVGKGAWTRVLVG